MAHRVTPETASFQPREFSFVAIPEKTKSGFYKYEVTLPFDSRHQVPLRSIKLTVWSENQFSGDDVQKKHDFIKILNDQENLPILLCSGLAANSTQYDRTDVSFIKSLDKNIKKNIHEKAKNKKSLFVAMSCPGFTDSDDFDPKQPITSETVSVDTYSKLIYQVVNELKLPFKSVIAGHSAGGAAVLNLLSSNLADARAYIALHPAIHKKRAWQFDEMSFLEQIKPILMNNELKRFATNIVIRYFLGLQIFKDIPIEEQQSLAKMMLRWNKLLNGLAQLSQAELEQVYLHIDEFMIHRQAVHAKLDDLHKPREHGHNTAAATTYVITGSKDKITRDQDINEEFTDVLRDRSTHTVMDTDHDDMFMKPGAQETATELIAQNALYDLGLLNDEAHARIHEAREQESQMKRERLTSTMSGQKKS